MGGRLRASHIYSLLPLLRFFFYILFLALVQRKTNGIAEDGGLLVVDAHGLLLVVGVAQQQAPLLTIDRDLSLPLFILLAPGHSDVLGAVA